MAIVSAALVGAAWFVVRRYWRRGGSAACNTGCGKCEPGAATKAHSLVQLPRKR